eukprot:7680972-Pyramimonas_sp.AAC.1
MFFERLPGRCLRGRWGSIDEVEGLLWSARHYIGRVFAKAFGGEKDNKRKAAGLGADEEQAHAQMQKDYRSNAVAAMNDNLTLALMMISLKTKAPLMTFLFSSQKAIK